MKISISFFSLLKHNLTTKIDIKNLWLQLICTDTALCNASFSTDLSC